MRAVDKWRAQANLTAIVHPPPLATNATRWAALPRKEKIMAKNMVLLAIAPISNPPWKWTEQRLYDSDEGYLWLYAENTLTVNSIDPNSGGHIHSSDVYKFAAQQGVQLTESGRAHFTGKLLAAFGN